MALSQTEEFLPNNSISTFDVHSKYSALADVEVLLGYSNSGVYTGSYGVLLRDGSKWTNLSTPERDWPENQDMIIRDIKVMTSSIAICFGSLAGSGGVATLALGNELSKWKFNVLSADSTIFDVTHISEIDSDALLLTGSQNRYSRIDTINGVIWIYGKPTPVIARLADDGLTMMNALTDEFPNSFRIGKFASSLSNKSIAGFLNRNSVKVKIVRYDNGVLTFDSLLNQIPNCIPTITQLRSKSNDPPHRLFTADIEGNNLVVDIYTDGTERVASRSDQGPRGILKYVESENNAVVLDEGNNLWRESTASYQRIDLTDFWQRLSISIPILISDIGFKNDTTLAIATDQGLFYLAMSQNATTVKEGFATEAKFVLRHNGTRFDISYHELSCELPSVKVFDILGHQLAITETLHAGNNIIEFDVNESAVRPIIVLFLCGGTPTARFVAHGTF